MAFVEKRQQRRKQCQGGQSMAGTSRGRGWKGAPEKQSFKEQWEEVTTIVALPFEGKSPVLWKEHSWAIYSQFVRGHLFKAISLLQLCVLYVNKIPYLNISCLHPVNIDYQVEDSKFEFAFSNFAFTFLYVHTTLQLILNKYLFKPDWKVLLRRGMHLAYLSLLSKYIFLEGSEHLQCLKYAVHKMMG